MLSLSFLSLYPFLGGEGAGVSVVHHSLRLRAPAAQPGAGLGPGIRRGMEDALPPRALQSRRGAARAPSNEASASFKFTHLSEKEGTSSSSS